MDESYRISLLVPCFGRPAKTRRILNNILSQDINGWEAFVLGDGCSQYESLISSGEIDFYKELADKNGNKLHMFNFEHNLQGHGYQILNYGTKRAKGKFLIFAGNDDILLKNHFSHYLSEIENTDYDMVAYKSFVGPSNSIRNPIFAHNYVGHSEIIVKTELIREYTHGNSYGHDWNLIQHVLDNTNKTKIADSEIYTYIVTHYPGHSIDNID
jgi:hypothetical protein